VHGVVYGVTRPAQIDPRGTWAVQSGDQWGFEATLVLEGTLNRLRGHLEVAPGRAIAQGARIDLEAATVVAETGRLEVRFDGERLGYEGNALLAGSVTATSSSAGRRSRTGRTRRSVAPAPRRSRVTRSAPWPTTCPPSTCRSSGR
jgi:hypothetical protein